MSTEAEIGWAAGLYEGEGTIGVHPPYGVRLIIKMTDLDVLVRWQRVIAIGKIYGPYQPKNPKHKPTWELRVANWRDIIDVCAKLLPWMCSRRQAQMEAVLAQAPEFPRGELACPAEPTNDKGRGYYRHRNRNEPPCEVCKESLRMYFRERNARPGAVAGRAAYREKRRQQKGSESDSI